MSGPVIPPPMNNDAPYSEYFTTRLRELVIAEKDLQKEATKIYKPMPWQEEFHACKAKRRIVVGGNRSGKSTCAFMETARAVMGIDPYDKYPARDGTAVVVGANWKHFAISVLPILFEPGMGGSFSMILDLETNKWRAYDPVHDVHRAREALKVPPLIPERAIVAKHWVNKGQGQLSSIEFVSGWKLFCFSSDGEIPQGFPANLVHIDEDVTQELWVSEMQARLADGRGINRAGDLIDSGSFHWSAMPHSQNDALARLRERAELDLEKPPADRRVQEFLFNFMKNEHVSLDSRLKTVEDWAFEGEDVVAMRRDGAMTTDSVKMYPTYDKRVHGITIESFKDSKVPESWTRYMILDPGHQVLGVLFAAVSEDSETILIYDELYIKQATAEKFGQEVAKKSKGVDYYAFIIDAHGGRLTDFGSGRTPRDIYSEALKKYEVSSQLTGHGFIDGCDVPALRAEELRLALSIMPGKGAPKLRTLTGYVPHLDRSLSRAKKKLVTSGGTRHVIDVMNDRGDVHLTQCAEYLAAFRPKWHFVRRKADQREAGFAVRRFKSKLNRNRQTSVLLGPASAAS